MLNRTRIAMVSGTGIARRALVFAVLASLAAVSVPASAGHPARPDLGAQTRRFVEQYKVSPERDARDMANLRRVLSPAFFRALDAAFREDRETSAQDPSAKPPHADFTFICSDGSMDGYAISSVRHVSSSSVDVIVSFYDLYRGETYRWKDRYRWIRTPAGWRLDDIECEIDRPNGRYSMRKAIDHG
ncbi:MAG: hypothetical protein JF600_04320 [Xanthomonadales bacterium]|nr:hypothetical protein [Xanthomonadales bacterium]